MSRSPGADPAPLAGRERAQQRLTDFVELVAAGSARAIVIAGAAGMGKTVLWRSTIDRCRGNGLRVLTVRAFEEEMSGAHVALRDLAGQLEIEPEALIEDADPFRRGEALLRVLRNAVEAGPLVLAIDDLHWVDDASARVLRHALRRLDSEPVAILGTLRTGGGLDEQLHLVRTLPPGRADCIELEPLTREQVRQAIAGVVPAISPIALRRIHRVSGGNPLYAIELARAVARGHSGADAERTPMPESLQQAIDRRLGDVGAEISALLELMAASGPTPLAILETLLPGADVESIANTACDLALISIDDDLRLRFSHPLIGAAVYARMTPMRRRAVHRRLAEHLDAGAALKHRALSTDLSEEPLAAALEVKAEELFRSGASDSAADYAFHSRRLTPEGAHQDRRRRTLLEVTSRAAAGETGRARELLDDLIAGTQAGQDRVRALVQRFYVENDDVDSADAALVAALDDVPDDSALRSSVLDILAWHRGVFRGDLPAGIECGREAMAVAERVDDDRAWMMAAAHLAHMCCMTGAPRPDLMTQAVTMADAQGWPALGGGPQAWRAKQLSWAGELDDARRLISEVQMAHEKAGNEQERAYRSYDMALLEVAAGRMQDAHRIARGAVEAAQDSANLDAEGWAHYPLALTHAWLGDAEAAQLAAQRLIAWPGRPGQRVGRARGHSVLGLLGLSTGDVAAATDHLLAAVELAEAIGLAHPGLLPVVPDAIEALTLRGDDSHAATLLERLGEQAGRLDVVRVDALYAQAQGIFEFGAGNADGASQRLAEARSLFASRGMKADAARAMLWMGRASIRSGSRTEAAALLADARSMFSKMGARLWEQRAAEELERVVPGGADARLTPTEQRVAQLVATGAKNREVAAAMFVSVATVEAHLTRVYRRLGIRSRTELAGLAGRHAHDSGMAQAGSA